ncbi:MAG: hypothetical protein LBK53_08640 [Heliobacteriaceae bacterium]|nr:hypothetical protein [Heliobacteriaceae bacterium]
MKGLNYSEGISNKLLIRHCERSEAIQKIQSKMLILLDCRVGLTPSSQ